MESSSSMYATLDYSNVSMSMKELADHIKNELRNHGLIVINNICLSEEDYLQLTKEVGEVITLPKFLTPGTLPGYSHIARVANFSEQDGTVNPSYKFGFYWHHDGDFWQENHIVNFLHSKIIPDGGGITGLISTRKAVGKLEEDLLKDLETLIIPIEPENIEDFRGIDDEEALKQLPSGVSHPAVYRNIDFSSLYVPFFSGEIKTKSGKSYRHEDLFKLVDRDDCTYMHDWKKDQMIVWDNLQYMHKAMGGIKGRRLLWRTQARLLN